MSRSGFGNSISAEKDARQTSAALRKKESRANLVAEVLGDLMEYLENNERYRQGKYLVMVPRSIDTPTEGQQSGNPPEVPVEEVPIRRVLLVNELRV